MTNIVIKIAKQNILSILANNGKSLLGLRLHPLRTNNEHYTKKLITNIQTLFVEDCSKRAEMYEINVRN